MQAASMAFEKNKYLEGLRDSMLTGIHKLSYKDGAFKEKISQNTPFVEALDILIGSTLPTDDEKCKLSTLRKYYVESEEPGLKESSGENFLYFLQSGMKFEEVFAKDANARGQYVPPLLVETVKTDGTVWYTENLDDGDDMGTWKAEYYLRPQARLTQRFTHAAKNGDTKYIVGQFSLSPDSSELPKYTAMMTNNGSSFF
jgi:hypothetical protein